MNLRSAESWRGLLKVDILQQSVGSWTFNFQQIYWKLKVGSPTILKVDHEVLSLRWLSRLNLVQLSANLLKKLKVVNCWKSWVQPANLFKVESRSAGKLKRSAWKLTTRSRTGHWVRDGPCDRRYFTANGVRFYHVNEYVRRSFVRVSVDHTAPSGCKDASTELHSMTAVQGWIMDEVEYIIKMSSRRAQHAGWKEREPGFSWRRVAYRTSLYPVLPRAVCLA
jgi:hypothetical protein